MKTIDIKNQKKILKKAKKVLNCILTAKNRIYGNEKQIRDWQKEYFYSKEWCEKEIATHKAAIVKLESYYRKIVSQL